METSINNKCKAFTSLEQSKKVAEILPLESADMVYIDVGYSSRLLPKDDIDANTYPVIVSCWSLAALLEQIPYELYDDDGNSQCLQINKEDEMYQLVYTDPYGDFERIETNRYEDFVDACYEMIIKLHELKML